MTVKDLLENLNKDTYVSAYTKDSANVYFRVADMPDHLEISFEDAIKKYGSMKVKDITCLDIDSMCIFVEE